MNMHFTQFKLNTFRWWRWQSLFAFIVLRIKNLNGVYYVSNYNISSN